LERRPVTPEVAGSSPVAPALYPSSTESRPTLVRTSVTPLTTHASRDDSAGLIPTLQASQIPATTIVSSNADATVSARPIGSGVAGSGPTSVPTVRVTIQSTTIAALPTTPSHMSSPDRVVTTSIAHTSWTTALMTKKSPKPHHSSKCSTLTAK